MHRQFKGLILQYFHHVARFTSCLQSIVYNASVLPSFTRNAVKVCVFITPQPLSAVGVLFSPMVSGWAGGWVAGY